MEKLVKGCITNIKISVEGKEIKDAAVKAYLNGDGSQNEICRIYGLNSRSPLEQWIKSIIVIKN